MVYVPGDCAHGFQTLVVEAAVRWNDPAFGIDWPETEARVVLARDQHYPDFTL
jgi:dTDP-4-dehydrorhamnose 3,5-epimerase-like enzyme